MAHDAREPAVSTPLVPALLRFARGRGASLRDLCQRLDLPGGVTAAEADEGLVSPGTLRGLFEAVEDACGEPWVGLRLASDAPRTDGPLAIALRASATMGEALDRLARLRPTVHPQLTAECVVQHSSLTWVQVATSRQGVGRHAEEYGLAYVLARCRELCPGDADPTVLGGGTLTARAVSFTHARPGELAPLQRFFGTSAITFGAERSALTLPRAAFGLPLAKGATLAAGPAGARVSSRVIAALGELLATAPSLAVVARRLALSERTLQRRLEEEGTTFIDVLDQAREARARELLRDTAPSLVDVAEQLGFADLATFSRAFKRWTGQPPGMYRRRAATALPRQSE